MVIVRHNAFVVNLVNTNRIRSFGAKGELYVLFFILYVRVVTYGTAQHDAVHYGKCAFICILYRIFLHHNSLGYILIMKALYIKTSFVISKERNLMGRFLRLALISLFFSNRSSLYCTSSQTRLRPGIFVLWDFKIFLDSFSIPTGRLAKVVKV